VTFEEFILNKILVEYHHVHPVRISTIEATVEILREMGMFRNLPHIEGLETGLKNAVKPNFTFHATCGACGETTETDNGEWLLWCGDKDYAQAILDAAKAYAKLMEKKSCEIREAINNNLKEQNHD